MSDWSPASLPRNWLVATAALSLLFVAYSVVVTQRVLLALFPLFGLLSLYLLWRLIVAVEGIADAQQRLADQRERR